MAVVQRVGARIYVMRPPTGVEIQPGLFNLGWQMWAELPDGSRVMTARGGALALSRERMPSSLEELEELLLTALRHSELPQQHRESQWGGIVEELARVGVETDAETVMRLPFELEPTADVRELLRG